MSKIVALMAAAAFTAGASAQITSSNAPVMNLLDSEVTPGSFRVFQPWELSNNTRSVSAGTADTATAAFGPGGGAFLHNAVGAASPGETAAADAFGRAETDMVVNITDLGDDGNGNFTTLITWFAQSFDFLTNTNTLQPYLPAGTTIGGQPVTDLEFSMGGGDGVNFNSGLDFLDITPGIQNVVDFGNALLTTDGAGGFGALAVGGDFGIRSGTQVTSGTIWGAGGADLSTFNVFGNQYFITYTVPAPAGVAVLGLGGLVMTRRRR